MTQQDDITQRLNEIHADAGYLFGRVAADGACAGAMAESVRARIDAIKALLSKLRAPVADERISLRGAANLAFNALHECKPTKGAEKQYSDAIQALQSALHDIAYTVNRTATPQQFADHLQREARAALSAPQAEQGERDA